MLFNEIVSRLFPCKDLLTLDLKYYEKNSLQRYGSLGYYTNTMVTNPITTVTLPYKLTQIKVKIRQIYRFWGFCQEFRIIRVPSLPGAWQYASAENRESL